MSPASAVAVRPNRLHAPFRAIGDYRQAEGACFSGEVSLIVSNGTNSGDAVELASESRA